jgi:spore maturation protein CgeB
MRIVYFSHSLVSCWNHGNAHFQRGVLRALKASGHQVLACEAERNWSRDNLVADQGSQAADTFARAFPDLPVRRIGGEHALEQAVDGADLVIVHEWTEPATVRRLGELRRHNGFTLLFHDTHHRAVSEPDAIGRFDLSGYDGILAFGETLARVYEDWGWRGRVFVWHEAADTTLFHPPPQPCPRTGAVWVGNWGDGERTVEIENFLLRPAQQACTPLDIHGVRYPDDAKAMLWHYGAQFHGWVANTAVPAVFARHAFTVHVPRGYYTRLLPGIPTIRVFEALACGIPLLTAPWDDAEGLFRPGTDYLVARDGAQMQAHMRAVSHDRALADALARSGLSRILSHHSCEIRAGELLAIVAGLAPRLAAA